MTSEPVTIRLANTADEVQVAYDLAARVFGPNYFEAHAAKQFLLSQVEPVRGLEEIVVAVDRVGAIVGLIRLVSRRLRFGDHVLKAAGITSVCVDPNYRARGIGATLIRATMGEARRRGDDVAVLFARRAVDGWYPKFGFVGIGQHVELRLSPSALGRPPALARRTLRLRRGFDGTNLPAYRAAYELAYRRQPGSFIRSRDWWLRVNHRLAALKSAEFLSLVTRGRVLGYALVDGDRIQELAIPSRAAAAATVLLTSDRHARGFASAAFHLHPSHAAMSALYRYNHTLSVRRAWDGGHMAAPLTAQATEYLASVGLAVKGGSVSCDSLGAWPVWSPLDEF